MQQTRLLQSTQAPHKSEMGLKFYADVSTTQNATTRRLVSADDRAICRTRGPTIIVNASAATSLNSRSLDHDQF
jgi:hypothetical protein